MNLSEEMAGEQGQGVNGDGHVVETPLPDQLDDAFSIWPLVSELFASFLANSSASQIKVAELLDRLSAAEKFVASIPGTSMCQSEQEGQLAELSSMLKEKERCIQTFRQVLAESTTTRNSSSSSSMNE